MLSDLLELLRERWAHEKHSTILAVLGIAFVLSLSYTLSAFLLMACWDAFVTGTLHGPAMSLSGAMGLLGLAVLVTAFVAVLKDWGE